MREVKKINKNMVTKFLPCLCQGRYYDDKLSKLYLFSRCDSDCPRATMAYLQHYVGILQVLTQ